MTWVCPNGHTPPEFVVYTSLDPRGEEGILVRPDGEMTNRYADGTAGVPADLWEFVEAEESAWCPEGEEAVWTK